MKVIDRTKALTQHFLENSFKKLSIKKKIKKIKIRKTQKYTLLLKPMENLQLFYYVFYKTISF